MAEDNNSENNPPELKLEEVVDLPTEELSDDHKTFLEENKGSLTDEQAEKFGITKDEETPNPDDVEPETRTAVQTKKDKEEEEGETDPEDEKMVSKIVSKKLEEAGVGATKDQMEVDGFIRDNPDYAKYRDVALKYMKNPSYNNIPAKNIMAIVSFKDQQKIGAQKEREATQKAKDTQGGGSTFRKPAGGKVDWSKATTDQIEAKKSEILGHRT